MSLLPGSEVRTRTGGGAGGCLALVAVLAVQPPLAGGFADGKLGGLPGERDAPRAEHYLLDGAASRVWFEADSRLGSFRGENEVLNGWAAADDTARFSDAHGRIAIDAGAFRTGIGLRDRHLRDELQTERHPQIVFELNDVDVGPRLGAAVFRGRLTIRGVSRAIEVPGRIERAGGGFDVSGGGTLSFTQFEMEPPSRLFGAARVEDAFRFGFHLRFVPARE